MKFKKQEFLQVVRKLNNYGRGISGDTTYYGIFEYSLVKSDNWGNNKLKAQRVGWKEYTSKEEAQAIVDRENEEKYKRGCLSLNGHFLYADSKETASL